MPIDIRMPYGESQDRLKIENSKLFRMLKRKKPTIAFNSGKHNGPVRLKNSCLSYFMFHLAESKAVEGIILPEVSSLSIGGC